MVYHAMFNQNLFILSRIAKVLAININDLFYYINHIDNLKQVMHHRIDEYGLDSKEAIEVSQIIDLLINVKIKKY